MREKQLDMLYEADPELYERAKKTHFRISILGGEAGEEIAKKLGYELTKEFFPIQTGGYDYGAMKGGLEGANQALEEMGQDPVTKKLLAQTYPFPKGIGVERMDPGRMFQGRHVKSELQEGGDLDHYLRLGRLIEESSANIVVAGGTGTEVEILANLRFDKKLKPKYIKGSQPKPLIFVGDEHDELLKGKFKEIIESSGYVYKTHSAEETVELVKVLQTLSSPPDNIDQKELSRLEEIRKKYILRF